MDAIELLQQRLVPLFAEDFKTLEPQEGVCEVFGHQCLGYVNVDSYGIETIQSEVLRCFCHPSYDVIGYAMGTKEKPTKAMRLIDYKSGWLIVPTDNNEKIELWCGGKYPDKISDTTPFKVQNYSGNNAILKLLEDDRPYLAISISPRKELYLKRMLVGDKNNLIICEETGTTIVPRLNWLAFKEGYTNLEKKQKAEALVVLRGINSGRIDQSSERVQEFFEKNMDFAIMCRDFLPKNPLAKNVWLSALGAI